MAVPLAIPGAVEAIGKAVTRDLVVIGGQWFHRHVIGKGKNKKEILTPINWELHVNPVSIGLGALVGAIAIGTGWFVWNGLTISSGLGNRTQVLPGLKDRYAGDAEAKAACEAGGGKWHPILRKCTFPKTHPASRQEACQGYRELYVGLLDSNPTIAHGALAEAKKLGCSWTQGL